MSVMVALATVRHFISSIPILSAAVSIGTGHASHLLAIGTGLAKMRGISMETVHEVLKKDIEATSNKMVTTGTWTEVACSYNEELVAQEEKGTPTKQAKLLAQEAAFEKLEQIVQGDSEELAEKVKAKKNRKLTRKERATVGVVYVVNERIKNEIGSRIKDKVVPECTKKFRECNRCEIMHHEEPWHQTIISSNACMCVTRANSWARLCGGIFDARIEAFTVRRIEESIELLISQIMDTAINHAIQSGLDVAEVPPLPPEVPPVPPAAEVPRREEARFRLCFCGDVA